MRTMAVNTTRNATQSACSRSTRAGCVGNASSSPRSTPGSPRDRADSDRVLRHCFRSPGGRPSCPCGRLPCLRVSSPSAARAYARSASRLSMLAGSSRRIRSRRPGRPWSEMPWQSEPSSSRSPSRAMVNTSAAIIYLCTDASLNRVSGRVAFAGDRVCQAQGVAVELVFVADDQRGSAEPDRFENGLDLLTS